ncbi:MAG: carbon-nitrogen hydrolase family protein [Anaerolineales bacterium]|jgi:predicted amidohydrolase
MITAAAVQMEPVLMNVRSNLDKIAAFSARARKEAAQIVVFPECAVTGYGLTEDEARDVAEPIPGPTTEVLTSISAQYQLVLMVGTLEVDQQGKLFNTAVLVEPTGSLARYRKTHLPTLGVDRFVTAGDDLSNPVDSSIGRAGMLICYDLRFPEPARVLALGGAQLILLSTAWPQAASLYPDFVVSTRAAENYIYLVAANRVGLERGTTYLGRSIIADPDGRVLAEAGQTEETIIYAAIDPDRSDAKHRIFRPGEYELDLFNDRRPDLYSPLAK